VDDCGPQINPLLVEGQVQGGIAHSIGQVLFEQTVYDENGQLLTGEFMDYAIPRASDIPEYVLGHTVTPSPVNPLGVKGVGERNDRRDTGDRQCGARRARAARRHASGSADDARACVAGDQDANRSDGVGLFVGGVRLEPDLVVGGVRLEPTLSSVASGLSRTFSSVASGFEPDLVVVASGLSRTFLSVASGLSRTFCRWRPA